MKQINGTVTLSFLEEDNQQRVIFRVIPLCTKEGVVFRDRPVDFPDQGSLRIVPDKREQSTFKERMRTMGSLCAIYLCSEGKELAKVRQNRNYDPAQGETNQFAIYSDVICEFAEGGIFEVFESGADAASALLPQVLIRRGMALYGPVPREEAHAAGELKPFGNENYLLHSVTLTDGSEHTFYWDPEQTVNWRQRRSSLRRGKARAEDELETSGEANGGSEEEIEPEAVKAPAAAPVMAAPQKKEAASRPLPTPREETLLPRPQTREPNRAEETPAKPEPSRRTLRAERKRDNDPETALPIGKRLSILDGSISFEEQIGRLDQPLSGEANLLGSKIAAYVDEQPSAVRTNGTPLVRTGTKAPQPIHHGETVHYVVEKQIRSAHREHTGHEPEYRHIDNPIENLSIALTQAWVSPETRQQAMDALADNEAFMQAFSKHLQAQGRELKAVKAAQEQLQDIEAERLSLLMQLETARNDCKRAVESMHVEVCHQKRAELAALENSLHAAKEEIESLNTVMTAQGDQLHDTVLAQLAQSGLQLCASDGDTVAVAPRIGRKRAAQEMVNAIRQAMNQQGFACNEDDATELLLYFALNDEFCICGDTVTEAELCAHTILEALGLTSVAARTYDRTRLTVASLLPENNLRTPTIEVCSMGRAKVCAYGHKTIRLADAHSVANGDAQIPVVYAPALRTGLREWKQPEAVAPASLESFMAIREEAKPLWETGEAWFAELDKMLGEQCSALYGAATQQMRAFVSAAACKLRGGFLAAADAAVLGWVVPAVYRQELNLETLRQTITELPRCLAALGLR